MRKPDMMIFIEPDTLEFAANGKSLGRFQYAHAREVLEWVRDATDETQENKIIAFYDELNAIAAGSKRSKSNA